jgi:hypothetical protein
MGILKTQSVCEVSIAMDSHGSMGAGSVDEESELDVMHHLHTGNKAHQQHGQESIYIE